MWFRYALNQPIDDFSGCVPFRSYVEDVLSYRSAFCEVGRELQSRFITLAEIYTEIAEAMDGFIGKKSIWEGDVRGDDLYVFALPGHSGSTMIGYLWKQDNNGSTFVASPVRLQWLDEYTV